MNNIVIERLINWAVNSNDTDYAPLEELHDYVRTFLQRVPDDVKTPALFYEEGKTLCLDWDVRPTCYGSLNFYTNGDVHVEVYDENVSLIGDFSMKHLDELVDALKFFFRSTRNG